MQIAGGTVAVIAIVHGVCVCACVNSLCMSMRIQIILL